MAAAAATGHFGTCLFSLSLSRLSPSLSLSLLPLHTRRAIHAHACMHACMHACEFELCLYQRGPWRHRNHLLGDLSVCKVQDLKIRDPNPQQGFCDDSTNPTVRYYHDHCPKALHEIQSTPSPTKPEPSQLRAAAACRSKEAGPQDGCCTLVFSGFRVIKVYGLGLKILY